MSVISRSPLILPLALEDEDLLYARLRRAQPPPAPLPERVHPTSARVFYELPLAYQDADEQLGWPLLAWLSTLTDQAGAITDIYDRLVTPDIAGDASALADPDTADDGWLGWLGQHVGVRAAAMTTAQARAAIAGAASTGFSVGTKTAIAAAAATVLTGAQFVRVYDHGVTQPGDGTQWDVLIVTRADETPDPTAVTKAVIAAGAKPAGVVLHQRSYSATWATEQTTFPTWADRNGRTWLEIEEAGL